MLTREITYTDYKGVERTETFCFNLNKAELSEMEMSTEGGFASLLEKIGKAKDMPSMAKAWKTLILKSYGEVSPDGRRFVKSEEISLAFSQTEAYNQFYMELATDADKAVAFVKMILPSDMREKFEDVVSEKKLK